MRRSGQDPAQPSTITPALLTLEDAARYLSLPLKTVKDKVYCTREIPSVAIKTPGRTRGLRRVKRADLDRLIETSTVPALASIRA